MNRLILLLAWLILAASASHAQDLPPCAERPTFADPPWVNGAFWCLEQVILDETAGEMAFTALAAAPDGTLYAARPLYGQILALRDADGDGLPESPRIAADGLTLPNGLAYHNGALYISGGAFVYRLIGDELETLVDDLPAGAGFWTGGLTVGHDDRLYVATGAACDSCAPDDPARGTILSFDLGGGDRQLVATGLRQAGDVAFLNGALWATDSLPDHLVQPDELNRAAPGDDFGWPLCAGADSRPPSTERCADAQPPALVFPPHSAPLGLAAYTGKTFPRLENTLLVTLNGSHNQAALAGFALAAVRFDAAGSPTGYEVIVPEQADIYNPPNLVLQDIQYRGAGLWPRRPYDAAVSAEGWVYLSVSGGRILALRPNE